MLAVGGEGDERIAEENYSNYKNMKRILTLSLLVIMSVAMSCNRTNPFFQEWDTPYGIPPFDKIQTSDYIPAIKAGIQEQQKEIEAIINNPEEPTFKNTIEAYELSGQSLAKVVGVLFNLTESMSDSTLNAVEQEAMALITEHQDGITMNKELFDRVEAVYKQDQSGLNREQQMVLKKVYESFARNGIGLSNEDQEELKKINKELAEASQKFSNNLLAENNAFKAEFGVSVSAYYDVMGTIEDRDLREKMFRAYSSRGNNNNENDNKELCIKILKLRARKAQLLGFNNWAEYQLDNKMAKNPQTVDNFLKEIMDAAVKKAKTEVEDMQEIMDEDIAAGLLPKGSKIEPWDWFYYAEKVRLRKYALDENLTRPYFLMDNVRDGVFAAANKVYGISLEEIKDAPVYHPEVKAFKVTDSDGSLLGVFLCDYFPRDSKRGGAWMNNFREQFVNQKGEDIRPIIVNVGNFTPATDSLPALITIDNVETAFHEFGHALHGLLSKCTYSDVSGTNVARDFVETFSQFNENWAFQPEILAMYAKHYKSGEVIPDSLVQKINASHTFNQGFMTTELAAASILDMMWHELTLEELENIDIEKFEQIACFKMKLIGEIIPRYKTTYFNHIFNSGYSAGYYSYLWSEVLEKDAFERFKEVGLFNKELADEFRHTFLEKGGSEEPMVLYEKFMGRTPSPEPMLKARGLE